MSYTPQTWVNGSGGGTPLSAPRLNYLEQGLAAAAAAADAAGIERRVEYDGTNYRYLGEIVTSRPVVAGYTGPFDVWSIGYPAAPQPSWLMPYKDVWWADQQ